MENLVDAIKETVLQRFPGAKIAVFISNPDLVGVLESLFKQVVGISFYRPRRHYRAITADYVISYGYKMNSRVFRNVIEQLWIHGEGTLFVEGCEELYRHWREMIPRDNPASMRPRKVNTVAKAGDWTGYGLIRLTRIALKTHWVRMSSYPGVKVLL